LGASHIFRCSAQFFVASWYSPTDLIPKEQTLVFRRALAAAVSELMAWIPEIKNPHLTLSVYLKDTSVFADCFFLDCRMLGKWLCIDSVWTSCGVSPNFDQLHSALVEISAVSGAG
jgi:hypothetical protein